MLTVFIDGAEGTTGLQLEQRLRGVKRLTIRNRKDPVERKEKLNEADVVFLCLPDGAAREAVSYLENPHTVVIDASTAHRTASGWAYGLPELSAAHEQAVRTSNRIAVPGCHATGFNVLVYPLVQSGHVAKDQVLCCGSLTGYSGGGKPMIAEYEGKNPPVGAKPYALGLQHKHLPEMTAVCGLKHPPIFQPVVVAVRQGMIVTVPLAMDARKAWEVLREHYAGASAIHVHSPDAPPPDMQGRNGTDELDIFVFGHETQAVLMARFDNLGKGASGAAIQCFQLREEGNL